MLVEPAVLHGDDRGRDVTPKPLETYGLAALHGPERPDPLPRGVIDVGVLHELRLPSSESFLVLLHDEEVEAQNPNKNRDAEYQGGVEYRA